VAKNLVDKAVEFVNKSRGTAGPGNGLTGSPGPLLLDEDAMRAADEEAYAFLDGVLNEKDRKEAQEYTRQLTERAVGFYGGLTANLMRLSKEIETQVMEDGEISRAIENHFREEGKKHGWSEDEANGHMAEAKTCLSTFLFNDVVTKYSFHATVKYHHHNDVAYGTFLNAFFSRLTDPKVRARAMARAREVLLDEGYRDDEINAMFAAQRTLKMEPKWATVKDKNGRNRQIVSSLYMKDTGLQSEVWKLLKQNDVMKATEMIDKIAEKTGLPGSVVADAVAMVGKTTRMFRGLPPEIKSRMLEFLNRVKETYEVNTKALGEREPKEVTVSGQALTAGSRATATADAGQAETPYDPRSVSSDQKGIPRGAAPATGEEGNGATVTDIRTGQPVKPMTADEYLNGIYEQDAEGGPDAPRRRPPRPDDDNPETTGPSGPGGM